MMRVYHTSDLHDRRGFAPRLRELRDRKPGLLFDCGDSLRGSQTLYVRNEPIVTEFAAASYDAQGLGNREFHYLYAALAARARNAGHPLVCTNLVDTKGRVLPFSRSLQLMVQDGDCAVRVHVFGALIMQYPVGSGWERFFGWRFLDPWDALEPYLHALPPQEPAIVLSHLGLSLDCKLAARLPRIDLLLGGHSHDTLAAPRYVGEVPIVHSGAYGRFVSCSDLRYDSQALRFRLTEFSLQPLLR